jgi:hypothetical protein
LGIEPKQGLGTLEFGKEKNITISKEGPISITMAPLLPFFSLILFIYFYSLLSHYVSLLLVGTTMTVATEAIIAKSLNS